MARSIRARSVGASTQPNGNTGADGQGAGIDDLIDDYDALGIGLVVQRIQLFARWELECVRDYELAHKARPGLLGELARRIRHAPERRKHQRGL